jgi:ribokinase
VTRIVVVGSANADLMLAVSVLPRPGETVRGEDFVVVPGGKGANQAVAAARLGGEVSFMGCVGDDDFGRTLRAALAASRVDVAPLKVVEGVPTGIAMILSEASGENSIAISGGANDHLQPADLDARSDLIGAGALLVCQFESPASTVARALAIARAHGVPALLNPAPARPLDDDLLQGLRFLVPNRTELATLTGREVHGLEDVEAAARGLLARGVGTVIVTLGADGVALVAQDGLRHFPAPVVAAVDSTGAGDTFVGAFAAEWCRGGDVVAAIAYAQRAAAISVTARGAQASMPWARDLV